MGSENEKQDRQYQSDFEIPEWQKEAVRKTLIELIENPGLTIPWDKVKMKYDRKANDENE